MGGIVRSIEPYGIFIELAPNLAGLAEPRENVRVGHTLSKIKDVDPEAVSSGLTNYPLMRTFVAGVKLTF